jgi:hypothetical protein
MIVIYALYAVPFVMLAVICAAIIAEVGRGNYAKQLIGPQKREARQPAAAVAAVISPFPVVIITATYQGDISIWAAAALSLFALVLGWMVWRAAEKLRRKTKP